MTDKQIIIDNIDVSECKYFQKKNKMPMCRACNSGVGCPYCEYEKDCYYKQLQRSETQLAKDEEIQVDMRLKIDELNGLLKAKEQECEEFAYENYELNELFDRLKAENDELKEEIQTKTYHWEQCTEEILKGTKHFVDRMEKAEKTLTEIKEIAESQCVCGVNCQDMKIILQKISECEGNDE